MNQSSCGSQNLLVKSEITTVTRPIKMCLRFWIQIASGMRFLLADLVTWGDSISSIGEMFVVDEQSISKKLLLQIIASAGKFLHKLSREICGRRILDLTATFREEEEENQSLRFLWDQEICKIPASLMAAPPLYSIVSIFIFSFLFLPVTYSVPFIVLHGIGNQCSTQELSNFTKLLSDLSGSKGYCIEVGNGIWDSWVKPIQEQAEIVCDKVKKIEELSEGYNIVALSQGNLIGRGVVEFCEGGPPVKNFVSLAGPHAGTASVPLCGTGAFCIIADHLLKLGVYSDYVQAHLAPSGYLKLPVDIPNYLKGCKFLPNLNNELPDVRNATYKERFSSLQNLVLIMFKNDTVLIPRETSWFGYYPDGAFSAVLSPQETPLYVEDWIGLKTLDDAGKVKFISVSGDHLAISDSDLKEYAVPYLEEASTKRMAVQLPSY
ncbi:hypothetical protein NE237_011744 [Protea cynaroides]|uniref:LYK4/5 third LysM domain-containing protein n=1 Tax=Protea cynaroides TaxID=273540 RepID=A0A9Q0JX11_9MAGN|nr:hypothetical protein NE237_011744 [Protea cynaroides]